MIEHLREACKTPMEKALFEFMFLSGCRIGEIVSLNKNSINWSNRSVIVRGKGDKGREVIVTTLAIFLPSFPLIIGLLLFLTKL